MTDTYTGYDADGRLVIDGEVCCASCHRAMNEREEVRLKYGGEYICLDCFYRLCRDKEIIQENLRDYIKENRADFTRWWAESLTEERRLEILADAYDAGRALASVYGTETKKQAYEDLEDDYRTASGGWEKYLLRKLTE